MNWRSEELRGGADKISAEGRGKLNGPERALLAQQAENRRVSDGEPNEVRARQAAAAEDMAKKKLQRFGAPWIKDARGQGLRGG
jgi:hypothetical protein